MSRERLKEGLTIIVMEGRKKVGVLSIIRNGYFSLVEGITALPIQKRDSVSSLRRLIAELPADVQEEVRKHCKTAKSTMTQDDDLQPVLIRLIEVPKETALKFPNAHYLSYGELRKAHPIQILHANILRQACLIE